jgi:glycosyltransferase involved in cell wall biosynthesis
MRSLLIESGVNPSLISVIPYGQDLVSTSITNHNQDEVRIAFIGTIIKEKGVHIFLDAARRFAAESDKVSFFLYGDLSGNDKYIKQTISKSREIYNLHLLGIFKPQDFDLILSKIDIVVVPSIWHENTPLVAIKSAIANKWLVMSNVYGLKTIEDYTSKCIYFEPGNDFDCYEKLAAVVNNWKDMREVSNQKSKSFTSLADMTNRFIKLYLKST